MADKAKSLLQRLHLKPSTTLKVSKTAIFILLGLISVQTVAGGLLWYADKIKASGGISVVGSLPNFAYQYELPDAIAVGPDGNVHVAAEPTGNNRIQETTNTGGEVRMWGEITGGPAQFQNEVKIAFDSSNNAYVLDQVDLRVVKFNSSRVYQAQFGSAGTGNGQFQSPSGIAVDSSGDVYVADSGNNRVQKFNSSGIYQSQFGSAGAGNGQFTSMGSITIDSGSNIYVADGNRIQKFNSSGVYQSQFGSAGVGNGQFSYIGDIGTDSSGNLYAVDSGNFRVQKFNSSGVYQLQWGSQGTGNSQFTEVSQMAVSSSGDIYVLDERQYGAYSTALKKFNSSGTYQARWGNAEPGQFTDPMGVTTDTAGNRYVVDYLTGRLQKFNSSNQYVAEWGGRTTDHTPGKFWNEGIIMLASDGSNNIYATNTTYVEKFSSTGVNTGSWALPANKLAYGIAASSGGTVYVGVIDSISSASSVLRYSSAGTLLGQWGSVGSGNGQFAAGGMLGLDVDSAGNVYVVDSGNFRIQKFSNTGTYMGQWGSEGSGNGQFTAALAISIDPQDRVYVIDYAGQLFANGRIQKFSTAGVFLTSAAIDAFSFTLSAEGNGTLVAPDMATSTVKILEDNTSIEISTTSLPNGAVGQAYSQTIATADGQGPTTFNVTAGSLPAGLSLNASTGEISGTPSVVGDSTFTVQATDSEASDTQALAITIDAFSRVVTTGSASNLSQTGASLEGTTNLPDSVTQRGFQYGLDSNYGTQTVDSTVNPGFKVASSYTIAASSNLQANYASYGMTVDADGNRFIVDTTNNNILKYSKNGILQSTWGSTGSGNGQFSHPTDIAISPDGKFYIVDDYNDRVQILSQNGDYEGQFALPTGDENTAVAVDSTGSVYVTGMNASGPWYLREYRSYVHRYNASGTVLLNDWTVPIGQGGDKWIYRHPAYDLAIDTNDDIYVVDSTYHSVHKINAATTGQPILTIGGTGPGNYGNGTTSGQFTIPTAIAVDVNDNVYIVDRDRIQKFNSNGQFILSWFYDQSAVNEYRPHSLWVDNEGNVVTASWDWTEQGPPQLITYSSAIQSNISGLTCGTAYHYRAFATDANGTTYGNDATFTTGACPDVPINIATTALQGGTTTVEYQDLVNTDNATGGVTYSVTSGALPDGLSLNSSTGYITGTPTAEGTFNFEVTAADSNSTDTQALSIVVDAYQAPLEITTVALPDIVHSQPCCLPYSENVYSQGSVGDVTYTVVAGTMPPGLSLQALGNTSISVAGNPTTPGTYTFTIQAQDSRGNGQGGTDTQEYTIVVPDFPSLAIDTATLPNGRVDAPYDITIQYSNYVTQPVFSLVSGSLPDGISLTLNGYLEGTPTTAGTYTFTIQAQDIRPGGGDTDTQELTLVVDPAPTPIINTPFVTITSPATGASFTGGTSVITGTGPANQTVSIFVDSQQVGTTAVNAQGNWSYSASGIAAGSHTLDAKWVPGAEVMFVPIVDVNNLRSIIKVYDTSNDQLIKSITLPLGSYAGNVSVLGQGAERKVIVQGFDLFLSSGTFWIIDPQTGGVDTQSLGQNAAPTDMTASPDGQYIYMTLNSGGVVKSLPNGGAPIAIANLGLNAVYGAIRTFVSADGSKLFSYVGPSAPYVDIDPDFRPLAGRIYVIDTADMSVIDTIDTLDNSNQTETQYPGGFVVKDNVAYVSGTRVTSSYQSPEFEATTFIKSYNLTTGALIDSIVVSPLGSTIILPLGGYYEESTNSIYFSARSGPDTSAYSGLKFSLANNSISYIPFPTAPVVDTGSMGQFNWGMGLGGGGTKLYTSYLTSSADNVTEVYSLQSGAFLSAQGYPLNHAPGVLDVTTLAGNNFIGAITPPKASIAFNVPAVPVDCTTNNTCPKPPTCEETNTCPKVDCTTTNTCPTTVVPPTPPTTSVTPKIISTQFPTPAATPSTSRLGWLDRTVLAVARFVPQQAAIGFPYVLFVLLLCFALSLYYQSSNEIRKDKLNRDFLAKRTSIRAQQDNFIALASHYLNTPITIIQGGVELEEGKSKK